MDLNELVNQIAVKVTEKIANMEENVENVEKNVAINEIECEEVIKKPKLLILSETHGKTCHEILENENVRKKFNVTCALDNEYQCDIHQFDVVVLGNLSIEALGKISEGISDTIFTQLLVKAILQGKKIIIPNEEIEVFQYRESAPKLYYGMMMQKIELLKKVGILFCNKDQLEDIILENECITEMKSCIMTNPAQQVITAEISPKETIKLMKRVITERDIHSADKQKVEVICITKKAIITDLAREYAEQKGILFKIC